MSNSLLGTAADKETWSTSARASWVVLVVVSSLALVNHGMGVFGIAEDDTESLMFALFACVNLYAVVVLLGPYRRGEMWAWLVTWVEVAAFAVVFPFTRDGIGVTYLLGGAVVVALAQVATYSEFGRRSGR
jgi:hypothetical protein